MGVCHVFSLFTCGNIPYPRGKHSLTHVQTSEISCGQCCIFLHNGCIAPICQENSIKISNTQNQKSWNFNYVCTFSSFLHSYSLMYSCWLSNSDDRPSFQQLVYKIEELLNPLANYLSVELTTMWLQLMCFLCFMTFMCTVLSFIHQDYMIMYSVLVVHCVLGLSWPQY